MTNVTIHHSGETSLMLADELSGEARDQLAENFTAEEMQDNWFFYTGNYLWSLGEFMRIDNDPEGWQASAHISNTSGVRIKLERCEYSGETRVIWQIIG